MRNRTSTLKLTRRKDGLWCKSIGNRIYYFGRVGGTEDEARLELLEFLRLRQIGQPSQPRQTLSLADVGNLYAAACAAKIARGDMQARTWTHYELAIRAFVEKIGRTTPVSNITRDAVEAVASEWRKQKSANRYNNEVQAVRTMFRWAQTNGIIDRLPIYGSFCKAEPGAVRADRFERGVVRLFTAKEIRALLAGTSGQLRAMILLGLNCGMYSVDISDLRWADVHFGKIPHIANRRAKTGVPRLAVLWPETVAALKKLSQCREHVFITRKGNRWNNRRGHDAVQQQFRISCKALKIYRKGLGFGALRHTHVSAVGDHPDRSAAQMLRGHAISGIDAHYDFPSLARVKSVADLARRRLLT